MVSNPPPPAQIVQVRAAQPVQGTRLRLAGTEIKSPWLWVGSDQRQPDQLWLPLDVLIARFGVQRQRSTSGDQLEWYGQKAALNSFQQRTIDDEVAIDVSNWLQTLGVKLNRSGTNLAVDLPAPQLLELRRGKGNTARRLVLDLSGPALLQRQGNDLVLELRASPTQEGQLRALGVKPRRGQSTLTLQGQATSLSTLTLAGPWRIVLDGLSSAAEPSLGGRDPLAASLLNPTVQHLVRKGLVLDRRVVKVGVKPLVIYRVGANPDAQDLQLQPLAPISGQQGLRFLGQLAQPSGALFAINGGFFNRVRQLPLGAVKRNGTWLSGPILNRGAIGWSGTERLQFGRLQLLEQLTVEGGRSWRLGYLNSGYVQRGLSRYNRAWGPVYRALSGNEQAITVVDGNVRAFHDKAALNRGVPIPPQADLVVARGGEPVPAKPGQRVAIQTNSSNPLGNQQQVLGGGPLLLQGGQVVLNGRLEGFSSGFLALAAPRTVVAQDRNRIWMLTLEGAGSSDPTLLESSLALRQLGISDALNLDGGSSTSMLVANQLVMTGRGMAPRVQNALGLVPK
ncbi:MAG: phosphodiester glycosidase family protein [Synechococcus sp.]|nr:phosphodiester glycosidase family protein [Synechococcus sp.]